MISVESFHALILQNVIWKNQIFPLLIPKIWGDKRTSLSFFFISQFKFSKRNWPTSLIAGPGPTWNIVALLMINQYFMARSKTQKSFLQAHNKGFHIIYLIKFSFKWKGDLDQRERECLEILYLKWNYEKKTMTFWAFHKRHSMFKSGEFLKMVLKDNFFVIWLDQYPLEFILSLYWVYIETVLTGLIPTDLLFSWK